LRKQLGLPIDDFLCVTTARFNYQKGYDILIEAIERLKRIINLKEAKMRFLFIGNGPEFEKMKAKSSELSNSGYVSFLGERKDVYNIVKACDLFVLTSRWEGLPIVLLETGLLKTPALASETYGNREILKGGKGILFRNEDSEELANSLRDIIEGKYDLNRYAQDLFKEVETNYNLEKMINGLRKIYKSYI
jgi:glycosyltransferase involved in cell wall biosynthesis